MNLQSVWYPRLGAGTLPDTENGILQVCDSSVAAMLCEMPEDRRSFTWAHWARGTGAETWPISTSSGLDDDGK